MKRTVVVTAFGLAAPESLTGEAFWDLLKSGRSAIKELPQYRETGCSLGGEVPDLGAEFLSTVLKPKRLARHTLLLLYAARQLKDEIERLDIPPVIRMGLATSCFKMIGDSGAVRALKGPAAANCHMISQSPPHAAVGALGQYLNLTKDSVTISTACAAGADAIGVAMREIREGSVTSVLSGGADCALGLSPLAEFVNAGMASLRNLHPQQASRPFDIFADSGVLSEGAGLLLLEDAEAAQARGARMMLEVVGYASHLDPDRDQPGSGYEPCMRLALEDADLLPEDIDYVSAWGPGHPILDQAEAGAIHRVFGRASPDIPVTSIKGAIGNPLAAAGPLQVIAAIYAAQDGWIPPTANLEIAWPVYPLNFVRSTARKLWPETCLINAHGVGGANCCLIVRKPAKHIHSSKLTSYQDEPAYV